MDQTTIERIKQRIQELQQAREQYIRQAQADYNNRLGQFQGAIDALTNLLQHSPDTFQSSDPQSDSPQAESGSS